jgi:hypothetical protein
VGGNPLSRTDPRGLQAQAVATFLPVLVVGCALSQGCLPAVLDSCGRGIGNLKDWMFSGGADKPSLLSPTGETHVLDGDAEGGGHAAGTGKPGKSEFPSGWSRDKILGEISDVATGPDSSRSPGRDGTTVVVGTRDGVRIQVIIGADGSILTGYPKGGPGVKQNRR